MKLSTHPTKLFTHWFFATIFFCITFLQIDAQKLAVIHYATVPLVSNVFSPIDIKTCGDDRLFIVDKGGLVRIVNADSTTRATPFLDFSSKVFQASEDGFLGMVFSPNYKTDGKFYVDYTSKVSGVVTTFIDQYTVSAADSNVADLSSELNILTQSQPFDNHLGGNLMFGQDGYLYINFGDGDAEGDPNGYGQDTTTWEGKILRLDVSNSSIAQPYVIPSTNPFFNDPTPGIKKEIWAYGVRNPWRSSVDRLTGDLWIADVGQDSVEEVDYQPSNAAGGRNYGWNTMEGNACYNPHTGCNMTGLTLPIYAYPHSIGKTVIGGYVDRSAQSKSLFGMYIFGDFTAEFIAGFRQSGGVLSGPVTQLITAAQATSTGKMISFGEDRFGDQYILYNGDGKIYKLQDTSYLRRPKAYFTPVDQGTGSFSFQGLQGRNLTYQWLIDNVAIPGATSPDYTTSVSGNYALVVTNTLNFSDTSDVFSFGALPLNLASFTAQKISAGKIGLQWKTASEQNISGYAILRKQNNETTFSNIGYVESKSLNGISNRELDYAFIDSSALGNSTLFYKLQIQNRDGAYTYSTIRTITSGAKINTFTFFPNPAKGQVQIYLDNFTQPVIMVLYDNIGRKVKEQSLNQQSTTIELPGLKGIYIVQLSNKDGSNVIRRKLVIQE